MAEFKSFTCDICGELGAQHLAIRDIDSQLHVTGERENYDGWFDICSKHMQSVLTIIFKQLQSTTIERNKIWKSILALKSN